MSPQQNAARNAYRVQPIWTRPTAKESFKICEGHSMPVLILDSASVDLSIGTITLVFGSCS